MCLDRLRLSRVLPRLTLAAAAAAVSDSSSEPETSEKEASLAELMSSKLILADAR